MNLRLIPPDSLLKDYLILGRFMEAPYEFLAASCMSCVSCLLRRNVWWELDESGVVFPGLNTILIGPPGIQKDTTLNLGRRLLLDKYMPDNRLFGTTKEGLISQLATIQRERMEDPACGYIIAGEIKQMFGDKDYEKGMVELLTVWLNENEPIYIHATRHDPITIHNPHVIMQAGSTVPWLKALPSGSMTGGFIPRFMLILCDHPRTQIANPRGMKDSNDRAHERRAMEAITKHIEKILNVFNRRREMALEMEFAEPVYANWYENRHKKFGPFTQGYAHRVRGHLIKLAMLSAIMRGNFIIDLADVDFSIDFLESQIKNLEPVLIPRTQEAEVIDEIKLLLPMSVVELKRKLRNKFKAAAVQEALMALAGTKEVVVESSIWRNNENADT